MANETVIALGRTFTPVYGVWVCQFIVIGLSNGIIAATIIRYEALRKRKEFLIICGLCVADFGNLLSLCMGAVYRIILIEKGQFFTKVTPMQCILLPQTLGWITFEALASTMLVVVSIDRLIAVSVPFAYLALQPQYAYRMLGTVYGFCFLMGALGPMIGVDHTDEMLVQAPCFVEQVLRAGKNTQPKWLYILYYTLIIPVMSWTSIIIYIVVGIVYWKRKQQVIENTPSVNNQQRIKDRKLQIKLTKTLAISTGCTFTFVVVPSLLLATVLVGTMPRLALQILWFLPKINPLCNVIIYYKRQPELRKGIMALFQNKQMPPNIDVWQKNAIAVRKVKEPNEVPVQID